MIRDSYIYNGEVIHKRFKPKVHYFRYKVFHNFRIGVGRCLVSSDLFTRGIDI